jgi:large subunit ribosomal protein L20
VLKSAKGYRWNRKNLYRTAKEATLKAGSYALRDRRVKKRTARALWITRLNIAVKELGLNYSQFIKKLNDKKIAVDRKVLSQLAVENPKIFKQIVEQVK